MVLTANVLVALKISHPGLRVNTPHKDLPRVLRGLELQLFLHRKGMTDSKPALWRYGEVIAYVW